MVARHDDVGLVLWFKIIKMAFQLLQSQSRINTPNNHSGRKGLCSSRKYPYPPPPKGGHFCLRPPTLGISIPWGACHTLLLPGIPVIFHLDWEPPGENLCDKNAVAVYHYVKCISF